MMSGPYSMPSWPLCWNKKKWMTGVQYAMTAMYSDMELGRYLDREFLATSAAMAVKVMLLWWCSEDGMEP